MIIRKNKKYKIYIFANLYRIAVLGNISNKQTTNKQMITNAVHLLLYRSVLIRQKLKLVHLCMLQQSFLYVKNVIGIFELYGHIWNCLSSFFIKFVSYGPLYDQNVNNARACIYRRCAIIKVKMIANKRIGRPCA